MYVHVHVNIIVYTCRQVVDETIHAHEACEAGLQGVGEGRFGHGLLLRP